MFTIDTRKLKRIKEDLEAQGQKIADAAKSVSDVIDAPGDILNSVCAFVAIFFSKFWIFI